VALVVSRRSQTFLGNVLLHHVDPTAVSNRLRGCNRLHLNHFGSSVARAIWVTGIDQPVSLVRLAIWRQFVAGRRSCELLGVALDDGCHVLASRHALQNFFEPVWSHNSVPTTVCNRLLSCDRSHFDNFVDMENLRKFELADGVET
jgi:hypothetical protein